MSIWTKQKINQIVDEKRAPYNPLLSEQLPYLGLEHIEQQSLRLTGIGNSKDIFSQKKKFTSGDILYGSLRPNFRKVFLPKFDGICSTDITVLVAKNNNINNYIVYLIASKEFIDKATIASNGTKMPRAGWNIIKDFVFDIPDLPTQTQIASVLSSYDDLIETNEKHIKVLEEMAHLLYTEWFVKFKFPGHEKVKMVDSGTKHGKIPEDWEVNRLGDFANLTMGQSPTSKHYNIENKGLPFHQGVADFGYRYPVDRVFSTAGNKYSDSGDLLFSVRAPVGRMNISTKKIILGRGLSAIRHKKNFQSLLSLMFANKFTSKDMIGNGAIYKSVNKSELENLFFVTPKDKIAEAFEIIVSSYFQEMEKLSALNINLSQTRDLLIPQLVTGRRELKYEN